MREIKFRAWDENDGVMISWENLICNKSEGDDYLMIGYKENIAITQYDHDTILMQYTGLKDKNGVEIWEGDIVRGRIYHMFAEDDVIFQIRWSDQDKGYGMHWYPSEVEVIGNIFESPELLGKTH